MPASTRCLSLLSAVTLLVTSAVAQPLAPGRQAPTATAVTTRPHEPTQSTGAMSGVSLAPFQDATSSQPARQSSPGHSSTEGQRTNDNAALPLAPRSRSANSKTPQSADGNSAGRAVTTVLGSLATVVGLFLLVAWFARRNLPNQSALLPPEVVQPLGRVPLGNRQHAQLIRVGRKLLLVSMTPTGAETLTEIDDPTEVDRLAGLCQKEQPGSISHSFRQALASFNKESASSSGPSARGGSPRGTTSGNVRAG